MVPPCQYFKEEHYHKPAAFACGFQKETIAQICDIKEELEVLREEVRRLRYHSHHNDEESNGGGPFTN